MSSLHRLKAWCFYKRREQDPDDDDILMASDLEKLIKYFQETETYIFSRQPPNCTCSSCQLMDSIMKDEE